MEKAHYMCNRCMKISSFSESDKREKYLCPHCGHKLEYVITDVKDEETGLVVKRYVDKNRKVYNPGQPIVKCPYCQSTSVQKLNNRHMDILGGNLIGGNLAQLGKNFHCNRCGADF